MVDKTVRASPSCLFGDLYNLRRLIIECKHMCGCLVILATRYLCTEWESQCLFTCKQSPVEIFEDISSQISHVGRISVFILIFDSPPSDLVVYRFLKLNYIVGKERAKVQIWCQAPLHY